MTGLGPDSPGRSFSHTTLARLLEKHVSEQGEVNYRALAGDGALLDQYLRELERANVTKLSRYSRLALLLNAYNAFTLKLMLEYPHVKSIRDIPARKRWHAERWRLGGRIVSLDYLEHDWIRPRFKEARVHFALVCASRGCPPLRKTPYTGQGLIAQLDDQARRFFHNQQNFQLDKENFTISVSELLSWFKGDFTTQSGDLFSFMLPYLPRDQASRLRTDKNTTWKIKWLKYDWSLNDPAPGQGDKTNP